MKLAIISGGSKGLGGAMTALFSEHGWQVVELSRSGTTSHNIKCDFSQPEQAVEVLDEKFASLSESDWEEVLVINNAGTLNPIGQIHKKAPADWLASINTNYTSAVLVTGLFLKHFQTHPAKKCIANVSSGAAKKSYEGWSLYCSAKAAMESFSGCVAVEQASISNGANSIIINPGVIDTDMQQTIRATDISDFPTIERFKELKAAGALESPQKVAGAVYSIISSELEQGASVNVADYFLD